MAAEEALEVDWEIVREEIRLEYPGKDANLAEIAYSFWRFCPYSVYKEDIDAAEAATDKKVDNILVHQLGKDIIESEIKDKFDKLGVTSDCDPDQNKKRVFWWIWQCEHLRN